MQNRYFEIILGIVVLFVSVFFIVYSLLSIDYKNKSYVIYAVFDSSANLSKGSSVVINGIVVGKVLSVSLNENFKVNIAMEIFENIKIPINSIAKIESMGLLDGKSIVIYPNVDDSKKYMVKNDIIYKTENYVYLEDKISKILFSLTN
jgi:phospholipid/cholesterol/gamma-HCH transport system substrate-binding protein